MKGQLNRHRKARKMNKILKERISHLTCQVEILSQENTELYRLLEPKETKIGFRKGGCDEK